MPVSRLLPAFALLTLGRIFKRARDKRLHILPVCLEFLRVERCVRIAEAVATLPRQFRDGAALHRLTIGRFVFRQTCAERLRFFLTLAALLDEIGDPLLK